jgi:hypothetical protein
MAAVACGRRGGSGASDLNPTARVVSKRRAAGCTGRRRRPAARGGGLAGETVSRVLGLDSMRGKHLDAAHRTTNPSRAALAAGMGRRRHTVRRRGSGCGGAPASNCGRCKARGHPHEARSTSSPPCASPGLLLDDEATAAALGFRRGRGARGGLAQTARVGGPGCGGALK